MLHDLSDCTFPFPLKALLSINIRSGYRSFVINTRFKTILSNGPYLRFFFRTLSIHLLYSYTVTSYSLFLSDSLLFLMYSTTFPLLCHWFLIHLYFLPVLNYAFGGPYLSFFYDIYVNLFCLCLYYIIRF